MIDVLRDSKQDQIDSLANRMLSNDCKINHNINELRKKIKAARLEKVMGRQTECNHHPVKTASALIISDNQESFHQSISQYSETQAPALPETPDNEAVSLQIDDSVFDCLPAINATFDDTRSLRQLIQAGMEIVCRLNTHSANPQDALHHLEESLGKLSQLEAKLSDVLHLSSDISQKLQTEKTRVARQAEQIRVLEACESKMSDEATLYRNRFESLQEKFDHLNCRSLEQYGAHYSRLRKMEMRLHEAQNKLEITQREKTNAIAKLKTANSLLTLYDGIAGRMTARSSSDAIS